MKKLFVIATLVGFGFCVSAQTTPAQTAPATTAPASTTTKKEVTKKEKTSTKMESTTTTPAKKGGKKGMAGKKGGEKMQSAPAATPAT